MTTVGSFSECASFWSGNCLYAAARAKDFRLDIAVVGETSRCREILNAALLMNIFSPKQKVTYRLFPTDAEGQNGPKALSIFPEGLSPDTVLPCDRAFLYGTPPEESADILGAADIIAISDKKTAARLAEIPGCANKAVLGGEKNPERLLALAKRLNLQYARLYGGSEDSPDAAEKEWAKLDGFTKLSNISSAAYACQQSAMLNFMGIPKGAIPDGVLESLARLEHIRWTRFHLFNGWLPGTPENGSRKDSEKRIHADLIPYDVLSEESRKKDFQSVLLLQSLI